jgi:hypothetical protein
MPNKIRKMLELDTSATGTAIDYDSEEQGTQRRILEIVNEVRHF